MGYINQFPDWTKPGMADSKEKLLRFFDLDNHVFNNNPRSGTAVELRLTVLTTQARSMPPDKVTLFQCITGTLYPGLTWEHADDDLLSGYGDIEFPSKDATAIEKTCFMLISRRFTNPALQRRVEDGVLYVTAPFINSLGETMFDKATDKDPVKIDLAPDGLLTVEDAKVLGIQCLVSQELRKAIGDKTDTFIASMQTDSTMSYVEAAPLAVQQQYISGQLYQIQKTYTMVRWFALNNGDFFLYSAKEDAKTLFEDIEIQLRRQNQIVTLSAIYDMTVEGLRTVRAPFHGFINPLTTLVVNTRYVMGTLVGFYNPKPRWAWLSIILQKVSFSTTGDENMMELSCVDVSPGDNVELDEDTGKVTVHMSELAEAGSERTSLFIFQILDWKVYQTTGKHSRLTFIAERMVDSAMLPDMAKEWEKAGKVPTIPLAIKILLERNKELLDTKRRKDLGPSPEYLTYKEEFDALGVTFVPYLYENLDGKQDIIKYRIPWHPDDDGTQGATEMVG
jgi:hypothetical protein